MIGPAQIATTEVASAPIKPAVDSSAKAVMTISLVARVVTARFALKR